MFSDRASSLLRRNLRMASGLVLFVYIGAHLFNHALGLISLHAAETGMELAVEVWYSPVGTLLLYGAAATHFFMALWAVYERRTFRLPPAELLRIALGFTLPILLIGHAASTRLAYETVRSVLGLHEGHFQYMGERFARLSIGLDGSGMAARLHGPALCFEPASDLPATAICAVCRGAAAAGAFGAGLYRHGAGARHQPGRRRRFATVLQSGKCRAAIGHRAVEGQPAQLVFLHHRRGVCRPADSQSARAPPQAARHGGVSGTPCSCATRLVGAGGQSQFPSASRLDVRRPGAVLDLPGARHRRWRGLSARRRR